MAIVKVIPDGKNMNESCFLVDTVHRINGHINLTFIEKVKDDSEGFVDIALTEQEARYIMENIAMFYRLTITKQEAK